MKHIIIIFDGFVSVIVCSHLYSISCICNSAFLIILLTLQINFPIFLHIRSAQLAMLRPIVLPGHRVNGEKGETFREFIRRLGMAAVLVVAGRFMQEHALAFLQIQERFFTDLHLLIVAYVCLYVYVLSMAKLKFTANSRFL